MPRALASRLARAKAEAARDQIANDKDIADAYVLAADTIVAVGPAHPHEAEAHGRGRRSPAAAVGARAPRADGRVPHHARRPRAHEDRRHARALQAPVAQAEIEAYIASREWRGKAGGYAIQGLAGCFVRKIIGSYTNVVGLPLTEVVALAARRGLPGPLQLAAGRRADR